MDRRIEHGVTHSLYIHDPNGYGVELLYDLPREVWEDDLEAALNYVVALPTEGAEAPVDRTDVPVFDTESIAKREQCSVRKVNLTLSLAFLAPDLVKAAIDGTLPHPMGVVRLGSMAQRVASTALLNSIKIPSPVRLTIRPRCPAIVGSSNSRRWALSRASVPSSSAPISLL